MLDTIVIQYEMVLAQELLAFWTRRITVEPGDHRFQFFTLKTVLSDEAVIMGTFRPHSYTGKPLLRLEFSVPHVVYGTNTVSVYDLKQALDRVNEIVAGIPGLPPLDVWKGTLARLDVCYDHQVGNLVPFYVRALRDLSYPHRKTSPYTGEGVKYWCKSSGETRFYDKYLESREPSTKGVLRQEVEIRRKKLKSLRIFTLRDLTPDLLFDLLDKELGILGLLGTSIGTYSSVFEKLAATRGADAAFYYLGAIQGTGMMPKKALVETTNIHPRTLNRRLRDLRKGHIPIALTEADSPLPPLVHDRQGYAKRLALLPQSTKYILPDPLSSSDEKPDQNGITGWACRGSILTLRPEKEILRRVYRALPIRHKMQFPLSGVSVGRSAWNGTQTSRP